MNFGIPFSPFRLICAVAFAVLLIGSLAAWSLTRIFPERDYANLHQRIRTWWVIVPLLSGTLSMGAWAVPLLFGAVSALALRECLTLPNMYASRTGTWRVGIAYLLIPCQYVLAHCGSLTAFLLFMPFCAFLLALTGPGGRNLAWGILLTVFCLSHLARIASQPAGREWLAFLLIITQFNDVAQYVWGRTMGRTPLFPGISPNKTREGLYGGLASTTLLAALLGPWVTPLGALPSMLLGALLALSGVLGDLTVSALKRRAGVKDTGRLLPGHGGILDRVDSLIYAAPALLYSLTFQ